jgi:hypothetical protein
MSLDPYLVIVAEDENNTPKNIRAFIASAGQGINYHRNIWHGVLTPLAAPGLFAVVDRIGETPNLEEFSLEPQYVVTAQTSARQEWRENDQRHQHSQGGTNMSDSSIGTPEQLRDPNYTPPIAQAIPLGIQHVMAMFASNVTPAIIVAGAAGFGFGAPGADIPAINYMIQMSILFAGVATLIQTIGMGPIGARLPIVQGTSFAFLPVMIPAGAGVGGMAGLMTGGVFHFFLGFVVGKMRFTLPPLVTGLIVLMIGLLLIKVGIEYAAGGAGSFNMSKPTWGSVANWTMAFTVIVVTLGIKFFTKGFLSAAAVLIGLIAGYRECPIFYHEQPSQSWRRGHPHCRCRRPERLP